MSDSPTVNPLEGIWHIVRAEAQGEIAPDLVPLKVQIELRDGAYTVSFAGNIVDRGTFTCEAGGLLTLLGIDGPNRGRTIPCRYQQVGDRLRVCYGLDGQLPTDFTTAPGQERYLATYRRD